MLNSKAHFDTAIPYDLADQWLDTDGAPRRQRVWDDDSRPAGMRLVQTIDLGIEADEIADVQDGVVQRYWRWFVRPRSADDDGSRAAMQRQELEPHLRSARDFATAIVEKIGLQEAEATAVVHAAAWHDLGKQRERWQRSIHNFEYPNLVLAKSGGKMWSAELSGYRHEFGSLLDIWNDRARTSEFTALTADAQDLVLHLIAAHHGRARPHFPPDEVFDPEREEATADEMAREVPRRFARLQCRYGRWGLAYLESLVRAADGLASQANQQGNGGR
jgi:CRISPR-associated endonuclease/helicase Cas3